MAKFISIVLCTTLAGLLYVYTEVEAVKIGYVISRQEENKVQMLDHARSLQYNIARLKAPQTLEKKLLAEKIQLQAPVSWQTLVLHDSLKPASQTLNLAFVDRPMLSRFFIGTARAEAKENR